MIRAAGYSDCTQICDIFKGTKTPWSLQNIKNSVDGQNIVLAADDGRVLGAVIGRVVCDECEVLNVAVRGDARGRGIGWRLLEGLEKAAIMHGAARMLLDVRESNIPAIKLYEKCGYSTNGKRKFFYSDPDEDAVLMEKKLKSKQIKT